MWLIQCCSRADLRFDESMRLTGIEEQGGALKFFFKRCLCERNDIVDC